MAALSHWATPQRQLQMTSEVDDDERGAHHGGAAVANLTSLGLMSSRVGTEPLRTRAYHCALQ